MGPSQGRFSQLASIRALGAHTGVTPAEVGMTTARPPWVSVPLGVLAGRPFEPAKRSAIHGRQREQNATVRWAGRLAPRLRLRRPRGARRSRSTSTPA